MAPQLPSRRQFVLVGILLISLTLTAWWVVDHNIQASGLAEREAVLKPRAIDVQPAPGDELSLTGHVEVSFDQPMDPASVERAISLEPALPFHVLWPDPETMWIVPESGALTPASRFTVRIATSASSVDHRSLAEPVKQDVEVTGFLKVTDFSPSDNNADVPFDASIRVVFNRPVVALSSSGQTTQPVPLRFSPDIPGAGEWINSSIFTWHPSARLLSGQKYAISVSPDLSAQAGAPLDKEYSWSFAVSEPSVVSIDPSYQSDHYYHPDYAPDTAVHVAFSQPMDRASVEGAFSLYKRGQETSPATGSFSWNDDSTQLTFKASSLLELGATYIATVTRAARSSDRNSGLSREDSTSFTVVPLPAVDRVSTWYGDYTVPAPDVQLDVIFNTQMKEDTLTAPGRVTISPEPLGPISLSSATWDASRLSVNAKLKSDVTYTVTINPGAEDIYGNKTSQSYVTNFFTRAPDPVYQINNNERFGVYDASLPVRIVLATRNEQEIQLQLYRIPSKDYDAFLQDSKYNPIYSADLVHDWKVYPGGLDYETVVQAVNVGPDGGPLAPGIYYLDASDRTSRYDRSSILFVVNASLTYKFSFDKSMVWLTDLRSGQPIPNTHVELRQNTYQDAQGQTVGVEPMAATTAGDGTASFSAGASMQDYYYESYLYSRTVGRYALVDDGTTFAIAVPGWNDGIAPHDFGVSLAQNQTKQTVYLYTDRPIYRPGQEVFFRGIVRDRQDMLFSIPTQQTVSVTIFHTIDYTRIEDKTISVPVSDIGTFNGSYTLPDGAELGRYGVSVDTGVSRHERQIYDWWNDYDQDTDVNFTVAEYRKPEFDVTLTTDHPQVLNGDTAQVTISADFFSGGPVSNATVKWQVTPYDDTFSYDGPGRYRFADYDSYWGYFYYEGGSSQDPFEESPTLEGAGVTDKNGKMTITFPAKIANSLSSQKLTVQAEVSDSSGQPVTGRTDVMVHKSAYYVGIASDQYWGSVGQPLTYRLLVVDWAGQPAAGQTVSVQLTNTVWHRERKYDVDGIPYWTWTSTGQPVGAPVTVTSDAKGEATAVITPAVSGSYRVRATVTDPKGNTQSSSAYLWASSYQCSLTRDSQADNQIDLIPDRAGYKPGDTASLLISSPFKGTSTALVTLEREGILSHKVITLNGGASQYNLPITPDLAPNVFVSVTLIKGTDAESPLPDFRMGLAELKVEPSAQTLNVTVTPQDKLTKPGATTHFAVLVTDAAGKPVRAEVSLALVDLAALRLAKPNSEPILNHFYKERLLGVLTSQPLNVLVDRMIAQLVPEAGGGRGGGGGGGPSPRQSGVDVREDFKDTAYWNATVRTGDDGTAQVEVKLPDNLTTWRMDARAVTADTLIGQTEVDIQTGLPLLITPHTPRFFVRGDRSTLSATVNNNTDADINATVTLTAQGVTLDGSPAQAIAIPAHNRVSVEWPVRADQDADWADVVFSAEGGGYSDAARPEIGDAAHDRMLPIIRYAVYTPVSTAGQLSVAGKRTERFIVPPDLETQPGALTVNVQHTLAASSLNGLTWLEHFQYECNEQFSSRLLPNSVTLAALRDLQVSDPVLEKHLTEQVNIGVSTLQNRQKSDGGWGVWPEDSSSTLATTYVLHALLQAKDAGAAVDQDKLNSALHYVAGNLDSSDVQKRYGDNLRAYVAYVLARANQATGLAGKPASAPNRLDTFSGEPTPLPNPGPAANGLIDSLYAKRQTLSYASQALLAQAIWRQNPSDPRLNTIKGDLTRSATITATAVFWDETSTDYWNWGSDVRTTAIILDTFAQIWPDSELGPGMTRWLVGQRTGDHWLSTQSTAWSLVALMDWMRTTKELKANYPWSVSVGDQVLASGRASSDTLLKTTSVDIDLAQLAGQKNFTVERGEGLGRLYYTGQLTTYPAVETVTALSRGLTVSQRFLDKDGKPVTGGRVGDVLTVEVTIIAPTEMHYVVIDDYYPAGAEPVDPALLTAPITDRETAFKAVDPDGWRWGWSWFTHVELHDERAVASAEYLPSGTYQLRYQIRLGAAGLYHVIPPTGFEFYLPDIYGRGDGQVFEIKP